MREAISCYQMLSLNNDLSDSQFASVTLFCLRASDDQNLISLHKALRHKLQIWFKYW